MIPARGGTPRNGRVSRGPDIGRRRMMRELAAVVLLAMESVWRLGETRTASAVPTGERLDRDIAEGFMRRAIELSRRGMESGDGGPFGAVIVKDRMIVGEGWNRVVATNDPTAHGEIVAIRAATQTLKHFNLKGCDIYTSAQPCPMCLGAIYWARLDRIYYGNSVKDAAAIGFDDDQFYCQLGRAPQDRTVPEVQLLAEEARLIFQEYVAQVGAVRY